MAMVFWRGRGLVFSQARNVTLEGLDTQEFYLEMEAAGSGSEVIQLDINGQPATWRNKKGVATKNAVCFLWKVTKPWETS